MKIKVRKIVEKTLQYKNKDREFYKEKISYENGYIEELEINPRDVTAFSTIKSVRVIGVDKNLYLLTLKSWKETKKELAKYGILQRLNFSKAR